MNRRSSTVGLASLTAAATAVAGVMLLRGATNLLEAISFVTGAVCVWLTVRQSVWNFPIGIANVAVFFFVFLRTRLFLDAGLQVVYVALGFIGWYLWLYGGANRTKLRVTRTPRRRAIGVAVCFAAMWASLYLLSRALGGASPLWDSLTTAMSLSAQWLLDRKHLESWWLWITVDVIYVPLYLSRGLYLTSGLYAVFLVMAVLGLLEWRRSMRVASEPT